MLEYILDTWAPRFNDSIAYGRATTIPSRMENNVINHHCYQQHPHYTNNNDNQEVDNNFSIVYPGTINYSAVISSLERSGQADAVPCVE